MGCSHRLDVLLAASLLAFAPAALIASPPPAPAVDSSAGRATIFFEDTTLADEVENAPADDAADESASTPEADLPAPRPAVSNPRFLTPEDLMPRSELSTAEARSLARQTLSVRDVPPESLLPPAIDPNDLLLDPFSNPIRMGDARPVQPLTEAFGISRGDAYVFRTAANVHWSGFYDTGYVGDDWNVSNIALDGSDDAHRQGYFSMTDFGGNFQFDLQNGAVPSASEQLTQGFLEMRYFGADVAVRRLYGRLINDELRLAFEAGAAESLWYDPQGLPRSIIQGEANAYLMVGSPGPDTQIGARMTAFLTDQLHASVSVEKPINEDVSTPNIPLSRWPVVLGRLRYSGANGWDTYQVAGLVRPFGVEDEVAGANSNESWDTGWGLSAQAHARICDSFAFYSGVTGGNGLGVYLSGLEYAAAGGTGMAVSPLNGLGSFCGLSYRWCRSADGQSMLWSNLAYGYALQESNPVLGGETIRKAQEAWCNLLYAAGDHTAVGLEYHYGLRDVRNGTHGDDQRILLVVKFSTGGSNAREAAVRTSALERNEIDRGPASTTYLRRL